MKITISKAERDAILAALSTYRDHVSGEKTDWVVIDEIANNCEEHPPLTKEEIDSLSERINK